MKTNQFLNLFVILIIWPHTHATDFHEVDKSVQLFKPRNTDIRLKCSFEFPKENITKIEWLQYDPKNKKMVKKLNDQSSKIILNKNENSTIYLCRVNEPLVNESIFNKQYVQEIHSNDLIEFQNSMSLIHFNLNYSIIQLTSQRVIVEIKSLEANYFSDKNNFKIVYNLIKSGVGILRGTIEVPTSSEPSNFITLEGLTPTTRYTLQIYLKTNVNPLLSTSYEQEKFFVFNLANQTFTTTSPRNKSSKEVNTSQSAFQIVKKKLSNNYGPDDYEYEDYDENYDYDIDESIKEQQTIDCSTDMMDIKNQIVTINYFPSNMMQIIDVTVKGNESANLPLLIANYKEFFQLNNLAKNSLDYSSYDNCRRQITKNSFYSKPLCLFNLAALWTPLDDNVNLSNEVYSVQTVLKTKSKSLVYFTSVCRNKFNVPLINLKKQNIAVTTTTTTTQETSTIPTTTIKQKQKFQSLMSSVKIFQLKSPNITSCYVLNDNEIQFKITQSSPALKYISNKPVLVYYLEFNSNDLEYIASNEDDTPTKKFFVKKENDIQVIKIDFVRGKHLAPTVNSIENSHSQFEIDLAKNLRSKRDTNESKSKPLVISSKSILKSAVFRIRVKLFSENSSHSSNFSEQNVTCEYIFNDTQVVEAKTDNNYARFSKIGVLLTLIFTLILLISGFFICFIMKNKYGLNPEYFLNLKNNLLFKSNGRSNSNNNLNSIHSSVLNLKKSKTPMKNYQQQYQLQFKLNKVKGDCSGGDGNSATILSTNYSYASNIHGSMVNIKNPMFNFNYEDIDSIGVDLFEIYVQKMHVDGDFGFVQLYEEITNAVRGYLFSSEISLIDSNKCKNRYSNILAYDHSRVKLTSDDKDETCGYINANYVNGYEKPNGYIATQGPMQNTFVDFWRMISEKNCSIICMITNVLEKGRVKCDQYWPDEGTFKQYGNIQVTHLHTITLAFFTKRIFNIKLKNSKKRNSERLVYQFHFTDWPDHGVPYYIMPVLAFIKQSSRSNPENGGPIVVHCSAGVGRTGTYIVIDAMMRQITDKSTINIHNFLKHIRHQRNYLVQTEEQFIFIYDVILESIKSGETELNEYNYKECLKTLEKVENNGQKLIDRQFELITEYKPSDWQVSYSQLPYNIEKNRTENILPVNNSRVILSRKPGVEGSDYINASYLHGCSLQDEFIVTQYPLEHTKNSFWQMVWDNNSNQIVALNSDDTENCEAYWLPINEAMECDSFTVTLRDENFDIDFVVRDFFLQSIDEDYEFNCRMISTCYWPESCTPIKTSFDLINKVRLYKAQSISGSIVTRTAMVIPPIIIHDLNGGHRAASFCALYSFQDMIQIENAVNVYEVAKMFHLKRPGIWQSQTNIMFLYNALEYLFEDYQSNQKNLKLSSSSTTLLKTGSLTNQNFTLPNISNFQLSQNKHVSNEALVGSRLYNFQNQIQKNRDENTNNLDSSIIIPLTENALPSTSQSRNFSIKGIPRMLPAFLNKNSINQTNSDSSEANVSNFRRSFIKNFDRSSFNVNRNSKAAKFVNSMMTKSSSFRRALFPKSSVSSAQQRPETDKDNNKEKGENPSLILKLASGSESSSTDNSANANESSLNSNSALIQASSVSPESVKKLADVPETTIILNNIALNNQSTQENFSSII